LPVDSWLRFLESSDTRSQRPWLVGRAVQDSTVAVGVTACVVNGQGGKGPCSTFLDDGFRNAAYIIDRLFWARPPLSTERPATDHALAPHRQPNFRLLVEARSQHSGSDVAQCPVKVFHEKGRPQNAARKASQVHEHDRDRVGVGGGWALRPA
jgi:hypothetical protein